MTLEPETASRVLRDTAVEKSTNQPEALAPALFSLSDVPAYLESRNPVPHFSDEERLFVKLPDNIQRELCALVGRTPGRGLFDYARSLVKNDCFSVSKACAKAFALRPAYLAITLNTFRAKYDAWCKSKDWFALVNRAKAGPAWQIGAATCRGLPDSFVTYCASVVGQFKRTDAQRQAIFSIHRHWRIGRNNRGEEFAIPGYEKAWASRNTEILPDGWSESNIRREIKKRRKLTKAVRALLVQGTAAASQHVPQVRSTRNGSPDGSTGPVRFMEHIQFDDVKTDWRVMVGRDVCDLWLLVARDLATGVLLGFGLRPARVREDGTQEHLKLQDMKQLLGWLFETFGLPPYTCHHKYERGTASISEGTAASISELFGSIPGKDGEAELRLRSVPRIVCHFSSMLGGVAPSGYAERKVGNARSKGSLESHNRLMHTIGADLPAQTGPHYAKRPADLIAREKEAVEIWQLAAALPEHLRGQLEFPILSLKQARAELRRIFTIQNTRTVHEMEGFEDVVEVYDETTARFIPQYQVKTTSRISSQIAPRVRKESPYERAARLRAPYASQWTAVSPDIIKAFYEHTQRPVKINDNGEIEFQRTTFVPPGGASVPASRHGNYLGYLNSDQPGHLYVTDGRGAFIGVWLRKDLVSNEEELQAAIRHSAAAFKAVKQAAAELNAEECKRLEGMRANNAEVLAANTFVEVAEVPELARASSRAVASPLATALTATVEKTRAQIKAEQKAERESEARTRATLRKAATMY